MKKFFLVLAFLVVLFFNRQKTSAKETFEETQIWETTNQKQTIINLTPEIYGYTVNSYSYLNYNGTSYPLEKGLITSLTDDTNYMYAVLMLENDSFVLRISKHNLNIEKKLLDKTSIHKCLINNNQLVIVGCKDEDAYIAIFDSSLNITKEKIYGGSGKECFKELVIIEDYYYMNLYRSGFSKDSCFVQVGDYGCFKSAIVKCNNDLEIVDVCYLNEDTNNEQIKNLTIQKNRLIFNLITSSNNYIYDLDLNLTNYNKFNLDEKYYNYNLLPHLKSQNGYLSIGDNGGNIELIFNNDVIYSIPFSNMQDYYIHLGYLYISVVSDEKIILKRIEEFEIIKQEPLYCDHDYYDEYDTNTFQIESFFDKYDFSYKLASPYLEKLIHGKYDITYEAIKSDGSIFTFINTMIVLPYTNFIDQGIYEVGKVLEFFGHATMDNKKIYYGEILKETGEHVIEITNVNGDKETYNIYVVNNYYNSDNIAYIPTDVDVFCGQNATITMEIPNGLDSIEKLVINNEEYTSYVCKKDSIDILFSSSVPLRKVYVINSISYYKNNKLYHQEIGKRLSISFLKKEATLEVNKEHTKDNTILDYKIMDTDQTFMYMKLVKYVNGKIEYEKKIIDDYSFEDELHNFSTYKLFFVYNLGKSKLLEKEVFNYQIENEHISMNFKVNYVNGSISNVILKLLNPKNVENLKVLKVDDVSIIDYYVDSNSSILKYCLIISGIIILLLPTSLIVLKVIRVRVRKKNLL